MRAGVRVRPAKRVILLASQLPLERKLSVYRAVHDADLGELLERLQPRTP
jgi:hypothetical protein